jgi:glucose-1-phosphate cytidylyltransferase
MSHKVVIFCGGKGTRIREMSEKVPKALIHVEGDPLIIHLMRYYAKHGIKDFILCLGYKSSIFKEFFTQKIYKDSEIISINQGVVNTDKSEMDDWNVSLVDTGIEATIGERLLHVKDLLKGEKYFFATYGDALSDIDPYIALKLMENDDKLVASISGVRSKQTYHVVNSDKKGMVLSIDNTVSMDFRINGGYMCLKNEIFDYLNPGEELVVEAFDRLISERKLHVYHHNGAWYSMDTYRDHIEMTKAFKKGIIS